MLTPLAGEVIVNELFMPPYFFGLIAFVALIALLQIIRSIGKDRPHS